MTMQAPEQEAAARLRRDPHDGEALIHLAVIRYQQGQGDEAMQLARRVSSSAPQFGPANLVLAQLAGDRGQTDNERRHLAAAFKVGTIPEPAVERLIRLMVDAGDGELARELLPLMLQRTGNIDLLTAAATQGLALGATDAALDLLDRIATQTGNAAAIYNHATALKQAGQAEAALAGFRRCLEADPEFAAAHHNLGNVLIDLDRTTEAAEHYLAATWIRRAPHADTAWNPKLFDFTTRTKLRHDLDQFALIKAEGIDVPELDTVIDAYGEALARLPNAADDTQVVELPAAAGAQLAPLYNRLHHLQPAGRLPGPAVNPALDGPRLVEAYRDNGPGWVVIDDFLTPEALDALLAYCRLSTFWFNFYYRNGYLGTSIETGFAAPLLLQIAEELRAKVPELLAPHPLRKCWSFKKCSGEGKAVALHADFAAVNSNFWITPDEANLDPEGGGLIVWDKEAPADWDFADYNRDNEKSRGFLRDSGAKPLNVPYRQNRMLVFNSDLFHESGPVHFKPGYLNHRLNITMLFGHRDRA